MSAIDTFRRAMRRHAKRARRMGLCDTAETIAWLRRFPDGRVMGGSVDSLARVLREADPDIRDTRSAFLYSLAADAVARLRVGLAEEATHVEGMAYAAPHQPADPTWDEVF